MVEIDRDAVLWSAPERERAGRPLLILLHGYGSHEGDLFGLTPHLPLAPVIASLRAPHDIGGGYAWFPLFGSESEEEVLATVDETTAAIIDWLDETKSSSVGLLGFSQGGATSLQLLRTAPERFDYAVNLSGFVSPGSQAGDTELALLKPPVFWGRGTEDTVIAPAHIERTEGWLPEHSSLTARVYENLAHSISQPEVIDVNDFLREQLSRVS